MTVFVQKGETFFTFFFKFMNVKPCSASCFGFRGKKLTEKMLLRVIFFSLTMGRDENRKLQKATDDQTKT